MIVMKLFLRSEPHVVALPNTILVQPDEEGYKSRFVRLASRLELRDDLPPDDLIPLVSMTLDPALHILKHLPLNVRLDSEVRVVEGLRSSVRDLSGYRSGGTQNQSRGIQEEVNKATYGRSIHHPRHAPRHRWHV